MSDAESESNSYETDMSVPMEEMHQQDQDQEPKTKEVRMALEDDEEGSSTSSSSEDAGEDIEVGDSAKLSSSNFEEKVRRQAATRDFSPTVQPVCLTFDNLRYSVFTRPGLIKGLKERRNPFKKEEKVILQEMSGHFLPGRLTAIMGPSGTSSRYLASFLIFLPFFAHINLTHCQTSF